MIQVISSVLVHYLDSQTPPVQGELVGQEDRVRLNTYRGGRDHLIISVHRGIFNKIGPVQNLSPEDLFQSHYHA